MADKSEFITDTKKKELKKKKEEEERREAFTQRWKKRKQKLTFVVMASAVDASRSFLFFLGTSSNCGKLFFFFGCLGWMTLAFPVANLLDFLIEGASIPSSNTSSSSTSSFSTIVSTVATGLSSSQQLVTSL